MYRIGVSRPLSDWGMRYCSEQLGEVYDLNTGDNDELIRKFKELELDAFISRGSRPDAEFFRRMAQETKCRVFGRHGTGLDGLDLKAATEYGIPVVFAPGANARSVAEYTVSVMLALFKNIPATNEKAHSGLARFPYMERQFLGKRIYILGFGNIGREVGKMCLGLGMKVSAFDMFVPASAMAEAGVEYVGKMEDGLAGADVVSVHTPLTPETRGMIDGAFLDRMKKGAFLLNTARSGIMVGADVIARVNDGRLGGAAFDDATLETPEATQELISCGKIIFSPHVAAQTVEALDAMAKDCTDGIRAVLNGEKWAKTANPEVYSR